MLEMPELIRQWQQVSIYFFLSVSLYLILQVIQAESDANLYSLIAERSWKRMEKVAQEVVILSLRVQALLGAPFSLCVLHPCRRILLYLFFFKSALVHDMGISFMGEGKHQVSQSSHMYSTMHTVQK